MEPQVQDKLGSPDGTGLFDPKPASRGLVRGLGRITRSRARNARYLLPELIKVYAGFSKVDGQIVEDDIDSSLAFLRYDYPSAVYSELRKQYAEALRETPDLDRIAVGLRDRLKYGAKIQLAVQLYVLISRSHGVATGDQEIAYLHFLRRMGIETEAQAMLSQLTVPQASFAPEVPAKSDVLETLHIAGEEPADLVLDFLAEGYRLSAFRFDEVILVKNTGQHPIIVRGQRLQNNGFLRVYPGQRALLGQDVFTYEDLGFYFNAKKNVSASQLYLACSGKDERPSIERRKSRNSVLEIKFGLGIELRVLKDSSVRLNGEALRPGTHAQVSPRDRLTLDANTEISFARLRMRARELGGRFELEANKAEYLVSNNASLLKEGDILLSPGKAGETLLRLRFDRESNAGEVEVLKAASPVMVESTIARTRTPLMDGDTITIGESQHLRCNFSEGIIEEGRDLIGRIDVRELSHSYSKKVAALDALSFSVRRGEMLCVMGPSGGGKSTLLHILAGHLKPTSGEVLINSQPLHENLSGLTPHIALVPDEDTFDPNLTVEENLACAAAIRASHLRSPERLRRVESKLQELGLNEQRHRIAGTPRDKTLSGGECKRLNAGLDMTNIADIYLFDEPTSGLSSKDAEHVLEIIRSIAHNKIVVVSIHQPSSRLFNMFDKAILIDQGGKLAFFGPPADMLNYFAEAYRDEFVRTAERLEHRLEDDYDSPQRPEFIFDVLETPLRDLNGEVIYETDRRGKRTPARRFSPDFWRDRIQAKRLLQEVSAPSLEPDHASENRTVPKAPKRGLAGQRTVFAALLKRAYLSKYRSKGSTFIMLMEALLLAILIGSVLRFSEGNVEYNFAVAFHIPTYIFLTVVVGMFLGLTSAAGEIVRDMPTLHRERNYRVSIALYITSKLLVLALFSLVQCLIYLIIGNAILEIEDMLGHYLLWMWLSSMVGVSIGLFISSLVRESKTATNIIPLVLVPQIILGGALIKYEQMNRNLDLVHSLKRLLTGQESVIEKERSQLRVPYFCEFMPLRWSYEGLVVGQAQLNPLQIMRNETQKELERYSKSIPVGPENPKQAQRIEMLKQANVVIHSLSGRDSNELREKMDRFRDTWQDPDFNHESFVEQDEEDESWITGEEMYINSKIDDLVFNKAEPERLHIIRNEPNESPNVFLATEKKYAGIDVGTIWADLVAMIFFIGLATSLLWLSLFRKLKCLR